MNKTKRLSLQFTVAVFFLGIAQSAWAGPPLICHAFDIGGAKSLPFAGGDRESGRQWRGVDPNYDLNHLVSDTLELLGPETPVIVRMETMRRAALYAVWAQRDRKVGYTVKDDAVARQLFSALLARARNNDGKKIPDSLAWFDAGYLAETYKQGGLDTGFNGQEMVAKAIGLRGDDPAMEFAAAIMTWDGPANIHREHLRKALAGAQDGSLLARNLVLRFGQQGNTIAELRAHTDALGQ